MRARSVLRFGVASWRCALGKVRAALNSWCSYSANAGRAWHAIRGAVTSMKHVASRKAFNSWRYRAMRLAATQLSRHATRSTNAHPLQSAVAALRHRSQRLGFNTWSSAARRHRARCSAMRGVVGSMRHMSARAPLSIAGWRTRRVVASSAVSYEAPSLPCGREAERFAARSTLGVCIT